MLGEVFGETGELEPESSTLATSVTWVSEFAGVTGAGAPLVGAPLVSLVGAPLVSVVLDWGNIFFEGCFWEGEKSTFDIGV